MFSNQQNYERLEVREGSEDLKENYAESNESPAKRPRRSGDWRKYPVLATVIISIIAFITFSILGYLTGRVFRSRYPSSTKNLSDFQWRRTVSEAQTLGCEFDLVTNNWTPKQCTDQETTREFRNWVSNTARLRQSWPYYYDGQGENQITSEEEMSNMVGQRLYTTTENHLGHCTFLMRRLHRFLQNDTRVISRISLNHTLHCSTEILKAIGSSDCDDRGRITSGFDVGITGC